MQKSVSPEDRFVSLSIPPSPTTNDTNMPSAEDFLRTGQDCLRERQFKKAAVCFRRLIESRPGWAEGYNFLGLALSGAGESAEALACFEEALKLQPHFAPAHLNRANSLRRQGRLNEAMRSYEEALRIDPDAVEACNNAGIALLALGRPKDAADRFREALRTKADHAEAMNNLGVALAEQGLIVEATAVYRQVLKTRPRSPETHNNLGVALAARGRIGEAIESYRNALRLKPSYAEAHNNLGNALRMEGRLDEAASALREALRLNPDYAEAHNNLAIALAHQGRGDEAVASYDVALRLKPDYSEARTNRALALLARGDFARGWAEYESRLSMKDTPRRDFEQPRWDGGDLGGGSLLVWAEQGLGDTLQFVRYAALAKARAGRVVLEAPVSLHPLLSRCRGVDRLLAPGATAVECVAQAPLLSLPGLLGTDSPGAVPAGVPYLSADPARSERWGAELRGQPGFKVGIAWQGSTRYQGDHFRSMPLSQFGALARLSGVRLYSLQKGYGSEQVSAARDWLLEDLGPRLDEAGGAFGDTAAVMGHLDLVVTSDTAVAHLAGGLGVPVWLALAQPCDWRWLLEREDSPWYPSVRLFRQRRPGDWTELFHRIAEALARKVAAAPVRNPLLVEISPGELLDKISILEIKRSRINDPAKLMHVCTELGALRLAGARSLSPTSELCGLAHELKQVNERLWDVEDELRRCEQAADFGGWFVELARSVYHLNDHRSRLKRRLNELCGAAIVEEKSHPTCAVDSGRTRAKVLD
jgi:tetratricopeptide (TPR) repeat protein